MYSFVGVLGGCDCDYMCFCAGVYQNVPKVAGFCGFANSLVGCFVM